MFSLIKNICLYFEQSCSLCDTPALSSIPLCKECYQDLPWIEHCCFRCGIPIYSHNRQCGECLNNPPYFASTQVAFEYAFPVNAAITQLKHEHALHHAAWLASCLYDKLQKRPQAWPQAIIPVPLHHSRLLQRGFNQSLVIGEQLSQLTQIPLLANKLIKTKHTSTQFSLDASHRRQNLHNAFRYNGPILEHVTVIDDVMTTGSTLNEISRTLKDAGIKRIDLWVVARTPKPKQHI